MGLGGEPKEYPPAARMTGGASSDGSAVCGGTATRRRGAAEEELEGAGNIAGARAIVLAMFGTGGIIDCVCEGGRGKALDDIREILSGSTEEESLRAAERPPV